MKLVNKSLLLSEEAKRALQTVIDDYNDEEIKDLEMTIDAIIDDLDANYGIIGVGKLLQALLFIVAHLEAQTREGK